MAYVVMDNCQGCRFTDCVTVCPVDCFYGDDTMLYIHPDECIDCGLCVPECPVEAIFAEDELPEDKKEWTKINEDKSTSGTLKQITEKEPALSGAEAKKKQLGK